MTFGELKSLISRGETLTVEFKSDRDKLPDRALVEAVVAMANTEGGILLEGVEDGTGEITGLHRSHIGCGTPEALIANTTVPPVQVTVDEIDCGGGLKVFAINVPECRGVVGTKGGYYARRRLKLDGTPEAVPMTPFEIQSRASQFQLIDPSAQPMASVPLSKIDPLQRERAKASIRRSNNSDKALLELGDGDFDRALGLVKDSGGQDYLTLAGVLLLTDEQTIREHVPTYEIAFQVLSGNLDVQVNDYMHKPLVEAYDNIVERFTARIEESEMMVGARRRVAPNFDIVGFREALTNALVHRDYCVLGTVIVKLDHYGLSIYSPGEFVDGVSLENILSTAPKSRNTLLADIAKRIGLAERTGRGVDKIFAGVLRYGRRKPSYDRDVGAGLSLTIYRDKANFAFLNFVIEREESIRRSLTVDELLALNLMLRSDEVTVDEVASEIQRKSETAQTLLGDLIKWGDVVAVEKDGGMKYALSPKAEQMLGGQSSAGRMDESDYAKYKTIIKTILKQKGTVKREDVVARCAVDARQAGYILKKMLDGGEILKIGERRWSIYKLPDSMNN